MIPIYFHSIDRIHEPPFVVNHELIQIIVIIPVPQLPSAVSANSNNNTFDIFGKSAGSIIRIVKGKSYKNPLSRYSF
jgi:hypothetical protein